MSLLKKTKSKKLNALVMASLLTFGFMSSVEAVGYRQLISYDSFPTSRPGSYDFGGNYESTIDYSREFYIQVDRSATNIRGNEDSDGNAGTVTSTKYWYYTPVDKTVYFSGGSTTFKAGELYLVDIQTETNGGLDPDIGITHLGDAKRILNGGLSEDEIKDLISNVQGDQTVNGSQDITGDQTVEGEQTVNGGQTVTGGQTVNGDSTTTGDSTTKGDGNIEGDLNVGGDGNVDGDMNVGFDGADDNGDGTPDRPGNMYIAGDTVIGVPGVPGAESNLHVTGNTTIDHDLYVGGEGHFDGNLYAPDLIFNGGKSLTGEISRLDGRIDTAGANAAALAGLHPLDFDEDQKLNFAAAVGSYQGASAMALGMFYRPDDRTMFNLGGTFGNRENMATLGISFALDGPNAVSRSSKKKMQEQIVQLTAANAVMAENNAKMQTELEELKAMVMELKAEKAA